MIVKVHFVKDFARTRLWSYARANYSTCISLINPNGSQYSGGPGRDQYNHNYIGNFIQSMWIQLSMCATDALKALSYQDKLAELCCKCKFQKPIHYNFSRLLTCKIISTVVFELWLEQSCWALIWLIEKVVVRKLANFSSDQMIKRLSTQTPHSWS